MQTKRFTSFLAKGEIPDKTALDESLEKHDKKFHGGHFDAATMSCGKRMAMGSSDDGIAGGVLPKIGKAGSGNGSSGGGWGANDKGNFKLSANDILKNVKFSGRSGGVTFYPNSGRLVKLHGETDPCVVVRQEAAKSGTPMFSVISSDGKSSVVPETKISHIEEADMFPERDIKRSVRLLRRIGADIPDAFKHYAGSYISGDPYDGNDSMKHFPSEREVFQKSGDFAWYYVDDKSPVPGFGPDAWRS